MPLTNPIWRALTTAQAHFASGDATCKRYPPEVAPFQAVAAPDVLPHLGAPGEAFSFVDVVPACPPGWTVELDTGLMQMTAGGPVPIPPITPEARFLTAEDAPAMVALTDVAFPGYFRRETYRMGTYMGVWGQGRLIAMAGERMAFDDWVEISAVCVHPDFLGRGYAQHLVARLLAQHAERGKRSFLHVSPENAGAIRLYEKLGFSRHAIVRLCRMRAG